MNYGVIYTVPFKSRKETTYLVEIQKEGYEGEVIELTGNGESPFSVEIDDEEFLYTPTRFSTATIRIVGNDYLQSLYSTKYQQYRVIFRREGVIIWTGFVKPELYTQDYTSTKFVLEIQCISAMSTLEYISYKKAEDNYSFVSLWYLLKRCVTESRGIYSAVYVPHVYAKNVEDYQKLANVLESMTVSEQNFFDEDDKAMNLKEVIEEICKFLNWTCVDWLGELYFVDIDHNGKYCKYTPDFSSFSMESGNNLSVQEIQFSGSDHTLDLLGGYNKASVRTSNYNVGDIFPTEDYSKLKSFANPEDKVSGNKVTVKRFYIPGVYKFFQYNKNRNEISESELASYKNKPDEIIGAMPIKRCVYNMVEKNGQWNPDITNYNWEELIQVRRGWKRTDGNHDFLLRDKILTFASQLPVAPYANGAIAISCYIQITANDDLSTDSEKREGTPYCQCSLSIGDKYYNGVSWVSDSTARFNINFPMSEVSGGSFGQNENTKTLNMPYDGLNGYVVELPRGKPLLGELKFVMYSLTPPPGNYTNSFAGIGYYIKDLKMSYKLIDGLEDELSESNDRYYENVVNGEYINELDEIKFKLSSYNNDGLCYGKVLLNDDYLSNNLYSSLYDQLIRPEEQLIKRIIRQYGATKIKLNQILMSDARITPITLLSDKHMPNRKFITTGGELDFKMEQFNCKMIENNGRY
jgi:hypothetical protein